VQPVGSAAGQRLPAGRLRALVGRWFHREPMNGTASFGGVTLSLPPFLFDDFAMFLSMLIKSVVRSLPTLPATKGGRFLTGLDHPIA